MFDNTKSNIIILADLTEVLFMSKTMGPYKIAHELRKAGFEVAVIHHLHVFEYNELKTILSQLITSHTLFVGFSTHFYQNTHNPVIATDGGTHFNAKVLGSLVPHGPQYNEDFKNFIKSLNPTCKLVIGGPDATDAEYLKHYDYAVTGYADRSVVNLAQHLHSGVALEKSYRSIFGFTVITDSMAQGYNFVGTAMKYADHDCILPGETLPIEISRGCIFKCKFCSYPLNGKKKLDYIKHENILREEFVDNWKRFGITRYIFSDDTFNDSTEKIEMIYRISKSLPFKLEYWAYIRLDLLGAHLETTDHLFDSGLRGCFFGIESLNPRTAKAVGKGSSKKKLFETLKYIKSKWGNQIMLHGSFIFGLPYESVESLQQTTDLLLSGNSPFDSFNGYALHLTLPRASGFDSELDQNYEKYGYKKLGIRGNRINWENEHLNFDQALEMADYLNTKGQENRSRKLNGMGSFSIASLGLDLDFSLNVPIADINWPKVDAAKKHRVKQYKEEICKQFGVALDTN